MIRNGKIYRHRIRYKASPFLTSISAGSFIPQKPFRLLFYTVKRAAGMAHA
jgi:hypothetical protein